MRYKPLGGQAGFHTISSPPEISSSGVLWFLQILYIDSVNTHTLLVVGILD